ncbi:MAG: undecaprenyl-phosphate glucose phosphotransferase, partial [Bacteroidetes bacterium HGW-Bacteroidetes-23]
MVAPQKGRYSKFIRPISVFLDLLVLVLLSVFFFDELNVNDIYFGLYLIISWSIIAFFIEFYEVYRFTTPVEILSKILKQSIVFLLVVIAYFPFAKESVFSGKAIAIFMTISFILIVLLKYFLFYYLKKY